MQNIHFATQQPNSVRAMFEDGVSTFIMSCDATLEELADRLGHLTEGHRGRAITFEVRLGSQSH